VRSDYDWAFSQGNQVRSIGDGVQGIGVQHQRASGFVEEVTHPEGCVGVTSHARTGNDGVEIGEPFFPVEPILVGE